MANDNIARFAAKFDSHCEGCGAEILEGDEMGKDKVEDEFVCDECVRERSTERRG